MLDFSKLKAQSGKAALDKLITEVNKLDSAEGRSGDDRFWQPTVDKAGNGYAEIRFLPAPPNEDVEYVRLWKHGFKGPTGQWYIENSLTTLGLPDPCSEYNSKLWNSGVESDKKIVRDQKRKLIYTSNIYVVSDPANPENEGKVFLFQYGKKIFDKLKEAMNPQFPGEVPVNPFDMWAGATFKLKIRKVDGYRNYDKSEFDDPAPLFDDDKKLEKIWKSEYSLKEIIDPKNFKSYAELQARLALVVGASDGNNHPASPPTRVREAAPPTHASAPVDEDSPPFKLGGEDGDDEDIDNYFSNLVNKR